MHRTRLLLVMLFVFLFSGRFFRTYTSPDTTVHASVPHFLRLIVLHTKYVPENQPPGQSSC